MFLESVISGSKVFTYWQTYVATVEFFLLFMLPLILFGLLTNTNSPSTTAIGFLSVLLMPALQIVALIVFILTLWPIIFCLNETATWDLPLQLISQNPLFFCKLIGVLFLVSIGLAFTPIIGQLTSVHTLVLGAIALVMVIALLIKPIFPNHAVRGISYWPGLWFSIGVLLISAVLSWIGFMATSMLEVALEAVVGDVAEGIIIPLVSVLGSAFGFIPLFIYGAWLGAQIKGISY